MTQNQLINEVRKERKRVQQNIRRMKKRGYIFDDFEIPQNEYTKKGNISKKTLKKLKALTPDTLYKKARWIDTETGEILTGKERRKEERHERAQKAAETRKKFKAPSYSIVDEILLRLSGFPDYLMKGTKGVRGLRPYPIAQYRELAIQLVKDRMAEGDILDLSEEYSNKEPLIAEKIMIIYQDSEGSLLVSHFTDLFALLSANGTIDTFYSTRLNDAIEEEFY
jgi:hypothetical protein